jgi:ribosomal protein S27E
MQPEGPHAVPDDPTTHHLCVVDFDTVSLLDTSNADTPPGVLTEMYTYWAATEGGQQQMRQYKNNIVFLVAEDRRISDARDSAETLASIKHVQDNYNDDYDVSGEAKDKLENMLDAVKGDLTSALRKAYSNMYYADTDGLTHESFTASGTLSDDVTTHLSDSGKLVKSGAGSYGVQWVESRLWNSGTDRMTTTELEQQFGKRPGADLLLSAVPLRETISDIVTDDGYAYWDATTDTGYYTAGAGLQGEQSVTDAKNLTAGLATSDVVIGDHTHVFSSVTALVEANDTDITWQTWECDDCGTEFTDEDTFTEHDCTVVTCDSCGDTTIDRGTAGADEAIIEAVFWNHRLAGVTILDRNRPRASSL